VSPKTVGKDKSAGMSGNEAADVVTQDAFADLFLSSAAQNEPHADDSIPFSSSDDKSGLIDTFDDAVDGGGATPTTESAGNQNNGPEQLDLFGGWPDDNNDSSTALNGKPEGNANHGEEQGVHEVEEEEEEEDHRFDALFSNAASNGNGQLPASPPKVTSHTPSSVDVVHNDDELSQRITVSEDSECVVEPDTVDAGGASMRTNTNEILGLVEEPSEQVEPYPDSVEHVLQPRVDSDTLASLHSVRVPQPAPKETVTSVEHPLLVTSDVGSQHSQRKGSASRDSALPRTLLSELLGGGSDEEQLDERGFSKEGDDDDGGEALSAENASLLKKEEKKEEEEEEEDLFATLRAERQRREAERERKESSEVSNKSREAKRSKRGKNNRNDARITLPESKMNASELQENQRGLITKEREKLQQLLPTMDEMTRPLPSHVELKRLAVEPLEVRTHDEVDFVEYPRPLQLSDPFREVSVPYAIREGGGRGGAVCFLIPWGLLQPLSYLHKY